MLFQAHEVTTGRAQLPIDGWTELTRGTVTQKWNDKLVDGCTAGLHDD